MSLSAAMVMLHEDLRRSDGWQSYAGDPVFYVVLDDVIQGNPNRRNGLGAFSLLDDAVSEALTFAGAVVIQVDGVLPGSWFGGASYRETGRLVWARLS